MVIKKLLIAIFIFVGIPMLSWGITDLKIFFEKSRPGLLFHPNHIHSREFCSPYFTSEVISAATYTASSSVIENVQVPTDFFISLLEKHKGKVIFVNCWAVWCGACKREVPYLNELVKQYEKKNVVFISLCIDSDYVKYRKLLSKLKIDGTNFCLTKEQSKHLRKKFGISGIPYYLLIDKNGIVKIQG